MVLCRTEERAEMAAASSLTAELETLQTRTTQTLQQIDENFSRANELAAELFPLAREFVKQLCVADSESKVKRFAMASCRGAGRHMGQCLGDVLAWMCHWNLEPSLLVVSVRASRVPQAPRD